MTSTKPTLYVRRQGAVLTIFTDPISGTPQPFYAWGQEPLTAFPMTVTQAEIAALSQTYDPVYIDPPPKPVLVDLADHSVAAQKILDSAPPPPLPEGGQPAPRSAPPSHQRENSSASSQRERLISHFREIPDEDVEAVGSFLIAFDPSLELDLMKARLPRAKKRFSLGGAVD
jgi:hypothetical protein